jgi:hypothetical protein
LPERREEMLLYFGPPHREAVQLALPRELDAFSRDARAACAQWSRPYPEPLEVTVRAHLGA